VYVRDCKEEGQFVTIRFPWREKYAEAMLELNREELPRRIDAAEKAIYQRVEELKGASATSAEELWAINDALRGLRLLAKTECPPQHSPDSRGPQGEVTS
jgi:thymidylate synthase ThyX